MANKRLIDANALIKFLEDTTEERDWIVSQFSADWIDCWIESAPTVDAVEVVHGRWITHNKGQNNWCECSECNTIGSPFWKRCPVCEAKMDGDGNV